MLSMSERTNNKEMKMNNALQAATEYGGFDLTTAENMTAQDVREYFTPENFAKMFPGDETETCGGWTLDECANAVIKELGL